MNKTVDIKELLQELNEAIERSTNSASESRKLAHNSYGAGYDAGERDALMRVKHFILSGEWPEF